jgi:L-malate glycosyltransferase
MHILFICQTFPEPNNQRKGIFYRDQAIALKKAGHQVGVIALGGLDSMNLNLPGVRNWGEQNQYIDNEIPVFRALRIPFPIKKHESKLRLWTITTPVFRAVGKYIAKYSIPDMLHSHNFFYAGLSGIRAAHELNLPHMLTEHSSNFLNKFPKDKQRLINEQLPGIDGVNAVSNDLADHIRKYVPGKIIHVIGNVVDTELFSPGKKAKPDFPFTYTVAAHLDSNKNVEIPIRAFHKIFSGKENFRLIICGNGPEKDNLITLTNQLGLASQVNFIDFLPREELISLYRKSHVVISSSKKETFGLTLVEAMACGTPVIATRSGGPQDFVTDEVGLLIEADHIEEMSKAMLAIKRNYRTYKPEIIRDYCVNFFSEAAFANKLVGIYQGEINHWSIMQQNLI